jgi:hypothetical protein
MTDVPTKEECIIDLKKNYLASQIQKIDLEDLDLEQLQYIVIKINKNGDYKKLHDNYVNLRHAIDWVNTLKVGDEVAYFTGSTYLITKVMALSDTDGIQIEEYGYWLDHSGDFGSSCFIAPITQLVLDEIEKENLVDQIAKETNFRKLSLDELREIRILSQKGRKN